MWNSSLSSAPLGGRALHHHFPGLATGWPGSLAPASLRLALCSLASAPFPPHLGGGLVASTTILGAAALAELGPLRPALGQGLRLETRLPPLGPRLPLLSQVAILAHLHKCSSLPNSCHIMSRHLSTKQWLAVLNQLALHTHLQTRSSPAPRLVACHADAWSTSVLKRAQSCRDATRVQPG